MRDPQSVPPPYDEIVHRLVKGTNRKIVFLLGAPLTAPEGPASPGVPGTSGIITMMRDRLPLSAQPKLDELEAHQVHHRYQRAFELYSRLMGQDHVNDLIRTAVLKSRYNTELPDHHPSSLEILESDDSGWHVTAACKRLAQLLLHRSHRFDPVVLTTNFDPLIEVAILKEHGLFAQSMLHGDGNINSVRGPVPHIVHLHGYWHGSDTLHTLDQLTQTRPLLQKSVEQLITGKTLVVAAYGGWDDVATRAIAEVARYEDVDIVWTFHKSDETLALQEASETVRRILTVRPGRVTAFFGIDVHELMNWLYWTTDTDAQDEDFHFWLLARLYVEKALGYAPPTIFDPLDAVATSKVEEHVEQSLQVEPSMISALVSGVSGSDERRVRIALRTLKERSRAIKQEPDFDPEGRELPLKKPSQSSPVAAKVDDLNSEKRLPMEDAVTKDQYPGENAYQLGGFFVMWIHSLAMFSEQNIFNDPEGRELLQTAANTLNFHCSALGIPRWFTVPSSGQQAKQEVDNSTQALHSLCASIRANRNYQIEQWCLLGYWTAYHRMASDADTNVKGGEEARTESLTEAEAKIRQHATNLRLPPDIAARALSGSGEEILRATARDSTSR
jgi:hypothetical protein